MCLPAISPFCLFWKKITVPQYNSRNKLYTPLSQLASSDFVMLKISLLFYQKIQKMYSVHTSGTKAVELEDHI
jgi:hypothetical protein